MSIEAIVPMALVTAGHILYPSKFLSSHSFLPTLIDRHIGISCAQSVAHAFQLLGCSENYLHQKLFVDSLQLE